MKRIEVTVPAALDIDAILEVSERDFGPGIANRYELLIATGIDALAVDSARGGSPIGGHGAGRALVSSAVSQDARARRGTDRQAEAHPRLQD